MPARTVSNTRLTSRAVIAPKAETHSKSQLSGEISYTRSSLLDRTTYSARAQGFNRNVKVAKGLSGVGIRARLYLGFGVVVSLFLCVGIINLVELSTIIPSLQQTTAIAPETLAKTQSIIEDIQLIVALLLLTSLIVGIVAATWLARSIVKPVIDISKVTTRLASGNYSLSVPHTSALDETGQIARAVEIFRDNAVASLKQQEQKAEEEKRLMEAVRNEIISRFRAFFADALQQVVSSASSMQEVSVKLQQLSQVANDEMRYFQAASSDQFEKINNVDGAIRQLSQAIEEISHGALTVSSKCQNADSNVESTMEVFQRLQDVTERISKIIGVITAIADQTNLLALNATIEAARAGEAGKGFSVVASEVKNLANQTLQSSHNVHELITEINQVADETVKVADVIRSAITDISQEVTSIADSVEQQSATSTAIRDDMERVADITSQYAQKLNKIDEAFAHTTEAAQHISRQSLGLQDKIQSMSSQIETFLNNFTLDEKR